MTSEGDGPAPDGRAPTPEGAPAFRAPAPGDRRLFRSAELEDEWPRGPVSPEDERMLHPAWILTRTLVVLRGFVPAFIALAVGLRGWALPAAALIVLPVVGVRFLEWRTTTYAVVDGALRLRRGILTQRERVVPASRISALDTSRGLVQRAFGLVSLEVQTAGGGKQAELRLDALTTEEAERLRAALGHAAEEEPDAAEQGPAAAGEEPDTAVPHAPSASARRSPASRPGVPVYAATGRQLVIAALTGPQLGLVGVVIGSAFSQAGDLLPRGFTDRVGDEVSGADAMTIVVAVILAALAAAAVSVIGTVLAYAEFVVVRDDRRLRVRRGLLTERTATIPLDRIHGVRIVEGLLRRPLGYATVQVEVAGYRGDDEMTRTLVPLVHRRELAELMGRMLPEIHWPALDLQRPPARARRRYWTIPLLVALVPAAAAVVVLPGGWRAVALLPLALGWALGDARWRGAGWALGDETLVVRSQLVARTTLLALARRAQRADLRSQPFQRRAGLATFDVVLATGRHGRVRHLDAATADTLQRAVVARTTRKPPPAVPGEGSLYFAAPPE